MAKTFTGGSGGGPGATNTGFPSSLTLGNLPPPQGNLNNPFAFVFEALRNIAPFASAIPGIGPLFDTPAMNRFLTQGQGAQMTQTLAENRPTLRGPNLRDPLLTLQGPDGAPRPVSLPAVGSQALLEQAEAFEQLSQLGQEQRDETQAFRNQVGDANQSLANADRIIRDLRIQSTEIFRQGLASLDRFRRDALSFIGAGIARVSTMLRDIRAGNQEVLDNIDVDITSRLASAKSGIEARGNQAFREHVRSLESMGPISGDERVALRAFYDRQTGADIAQAAGSLHEAAIEFRGKTAADLQTSFNTASSFAISTVGNLTGVGVQAFQQAETLSAGLRRTQMDNQRALVIAQAELREYSAQYNLEAGAQLFDMVSQTVRPVHVFSDILQGMFDIGWEVLNFSNSVEQQIWANFILEQNPQNEAAFAALGMSEQERMAHDARVATADAGQRDTATALGVAAINAIPGPKPST